jgi:hypothetical protein
MPSTYVSDLTKVMSGLYLWEPPTKRQESGGGLVTWQLSSDATVEDWLRGYRAVPTQQWRTGYMATEQCRRNNGGLVTWLPSSVDATMEEPSGRCFYFVCLEVRDNKDSTGKSLEL